MPGPVGVGRFVIRATRERGVGVPSSRSLATASREASVTIRRNAAATVPDAVTAKSPAALSMDWFNPSTAHQHYAVQRLFLKPRSSGCANCLPKVGADVFARTAPCASTATAAARRRTFRSTAGYPSIDRSAVAHDHPRALAQSPHGPDACISRYFSSPLRRSQSSTDWTSPHFSPASMAAAMTSPGCPPAMASGSFCDRAKRLLDRSQAHAQALGDVAERRARRAHPGHFGIPFTLRLPIHPTPVVGVLCEFIALQLSYASKRRHRHVFGCILRVFGPSNVHDLRVLLAGCPNRGRLYPEGESGCSAGACHREGHSFRPLPALLHGPEIRIPVLASFPRVYWHGRARRPVAGRLRCSR